MTPLSLFHRSACFVPCRGGAVVPNALDAATCFDCALVHGLVEANHGRYNEAMLAAVPRDDPGGGGVGAMLASMWRNGLCSRCGHQLAECDLAGRCTRCLLPEGWSPERDADRIWRIDDREAYRAVWRSVRAATPGNVDDDLWERAARDFTRAGIWDRAALDDRLRAVAWTQGLEEVHLPHLVAVWAVSGSDLAQQLTAIARHADETGAFTDYRKASANGSYLAADGWHILLRASMPEGIAPESVRPVAWRTNAWLVGERRV